MLYKSLAKLSSATFIAQLITFSATILLTQIYSVEAFGEYAFVLAVSQFVPIFLIGRLELAFMNYKSPIVASQLLAAILFSVSLLSPFVFILTDLFLSGGSFPLVTSIIFICAALNQLLIKFVNFSNNYGVIGKHSLILALCCNGGQLLLGSYSLKPDSKMLLLGYMLGSLVAVSYLLYKALPSINLGFKKLTYNRFVYFYKRNIELMIFNIGNAFQNKLTMEGPVLLLGVFYGAQAVGYYSLIRRVLNQPINMISSNLSLIYHGRFSKSFFSKQAGNTKVMLNFSKITLILSIAIIIVVLSSGEELFSLVFGSDWAEAGTYAIYLLPMVIGRFIVIPIEPTFWVAGHSKLFFKINAAKFLLSMSFLIAGGLLLDITQTIFLYSISTGFVYLFSFFVVLKIVRKLDFSYLNDKGV